MAYFGKWHSYLFTRLPLIISNFTIKKSHPLWQSHLASNTPSQLLVTHPLTLIYEAQLLTGTVVRKADGGRLRLPRKCRLCPREKWVEWAESAPSTPLSILLLILLCKGTTPLLDLQRHKPSFRLAKAQRSSFAKAHPSFRVAKAQLSYRLASL